MFGSEAGKGPGVGDRIIYFKNVRVLWLALNGQIDFAVLGYESPRADAAESLRGDLAAAKSGSGQNNSGPDATTLQYLLNMDPFCGRVLNTVNRPPLVGPPRFLPADPPARSGSGTGAGGDVFAISVDQTAEDKTTQTSTQLHVTDEKPGWMTSLFGGSNTETNTTMTLTNTVVSDVQNEEKITNTLTMVSMDGTDPYDIKIFYDTTCGTFLYADKNSPVLQGGAPVSRS